MHHRKELKIGIITDSRNQCIAETYLSLLKESSFASHHRIPLTFDPLHPERITELMERKSVMLAHVGIPGRHDYQKNLHSFLDAYAAVKRKPPTGIVTHDAEHTRYVIERWLTGSSRSPRDLPDGAVSIIDASRPLRPRTLEKALDILLANMPKLPATRLHAIPLNQVHVESLNNPALDSIVS